MYGQLRSWMVKALEPVYRGLRVARCHRRRGTRRPTAGCDGRIWGSGSTNVALLRPEVSATTTWTGCAKG